MQKFVKELCINIHNIVATAYCAEIAVVCPACVNAHDVHSGRDKYSRGKCSEGKMTVSR